MNNLLLILEILVTFSMVILIKKFLGKNGLYVWIALATVLANIQLVKQVDLLGISATLGNVMFASTFLATDIISECYGKKEAKKAVILGVTSVLIYVIISQITLLYVPNSLDTVSESMKNIFSTSPRICIASITMYFLANYFDVLLYNFLKKKSKGKNMWLRNNISTIICNCLENFGLYILIFIGVFGIKDIFQMAIACSIIEIVIALCDTPFLYIAKKINQPNESRV